MLINNSKKSFHSDCRCLLDIYQEQQLYYKEITEACVGSCESRRAVSSLLPFWILHISVRETVSWSALLPFAFNREAWMFFRTCLFFKWDSFPDNCVDWTNDFRKMDMLKVNNLDKPIALEHRRPKLSFWGVKLFLSLIKQACGVGSACETWHSYCCHFLFTMTEVHYDSRLSAYGGIGIEVSYFY